MHSESSSLSPWCTGKDSCPVSGFKFGWLERINCWERGHKDWGFEINWFFHMSDVYAMCVGVPSVFHTCYQSLVLKVQWLGQVFYHISSALPVRLGTTVDESIPLDDQMIGVILTDVVCSTDIDDAVVRSMKEHEECRNLKIRKKTGFFHLWKMTRTFNLLILPLKKWIKCSWKIWYFIDNSGLLVTKIAEQSVRPLCLSMANAVCSFFTVMILFREFYFHYYWDVSTHLFFQEVDQQQEGSKPWLTIANTITLSA